MNDQATPFEREIDAVYGPAKKRKPDGYVSVWIEILGVKTEIEADVFATWYAPQAETSSHPGTVAGYVVDEVVWEGMYLTPLLSDNQLHKIARELDP